MKKPKISTGGAAVDRKTKVLAAAVNTTAPSSK